ncbi:hypothetical protein VTH8203_04489 [Vibrio thalassae]|uniref:Uncharacterized protein n=1 Tax=Vibrio thalassae TaxID=1243014 RepID=A0A240ERD8_9VIBR|nr:hypothetical protein [Vibrio thalassae]SNX50815.1 hypothetical protein VTH8203_04489 [Vibrio thalassae]
MLQDIVVHSIRSFQSDCQKLCHQHYPAVHNGGMAEQHLGLAFSRRLAASFSHFGQSASITALDSKNDSKSSTDYRISSSMGSIWVITHHFVNANVATKERLLTHLQQWQAENCYAVQHKDIVVIIADHWINRCSHSRGIIHWWQNSLPADLDSYARQGVKLLYADSCLSDLLRNRLKMTPTYIHYTHPLQRTISQEPVLKYTQLFAIIQP